MKKDFRHPATRRLARNIARITAESLSLGLTFVASASGANAGGWPDYGHGDSREGGSCSASHSAPSDAVCDPFGGGESPDDPAAGLAGQLVYLSADQPRYTSVKQYMQYGHPVNEELYFSRLNVPTRNFSLGFSSQSGALLKASNGQTLFEYFGIRFDTQIKLGHRDSPGLYQFAVVSDDGSIMRIGDGHGGLQSWIDNDGYASSRMACASHAVYFDPSTRLPAQIDYFQGPRYDIALLLIWREVRSDTSLDLRESACGQSGNAWFFDATRNPSQPTANWVRLLDRGWKVLAKDNFVLPSSAGANPCAGNCFRDQFKDPASATLALSRPNADPSSITVTVDDDNARFTFDRAHNTVTVEGCTRRTEKVNVKYCVLPSPTSSPSPSPSATPSPSPTLTASPSPSPVVSVTPSPSPSVVVTPSPAVTPTPSPTVSVTPTPSPTVSVTPTPSPTISVTPTPSPTISITPTPSPTVSVTPTPSPTVSVTSTPSPTVSVTPTPTVTPSASPSVTPTGSPTASPSPSPTCTGALCGGGEIGV